MAASHAAHRPTPRWVWAFPLLGLAVMLFGKATPAVVVAAALLGCVFAAVHLAETVALRVGETFGSLILAGAVTVLEAGMIVSMMLGGSGPTVARDAIFAALMIALNGIVGLALVVNAARHGAGRFSAPAANAFLAVLIPLAVLTLVLPNFTVSAPGPVFSVPQLVFVSVVSLALYGVFLYVQLVRHREDFVAAHDLDEPHGGPSAAEAWIAFALLVVALALVILLAKKLSPSLEAGVAAIGALVAMVGVAIAAIVLLPEGITAVAVVAMLLGQPLHLGLEPAMTVLLATTFLLLSVTLGFGRSTVLEGVVHLSVLAAFLMFTFLP
jgi:Ca2+:H+ antiporter